MFILFKNTYSSGICALIQIRKANLNKIQGFKKQLLEINLGIGISLKIVDTDCITSLLDSTCIYNMLRYNQIVILYGT